MYFNRWGVADWTWSGGGGGGGAQKTRRRRSGRRRLLAPREARAWSPQCGFRRAARHIRAPLPLSDDPLPSSSLLSPLLVFLRLLAPRPPPAFLIIILTSILPSSSSSASFFSIARGQQYFWIWEGAGKPAGEDACWPNSWRFAYPHQPFLPSACAV
ncbi:unnamed protein product [Prorocentrum cordatum]|uniref:Uncharacterized protein n=1 Tax=Prorocentrum cordatum TaxID=2364126 RepID=A0ABN9VIM9_9DINO|nr:unnamed protein product [Polarella glacialis]